MVAGALGDVRVAEHPLLMARKGAPTTLIRRLFSAGCFQHRKTGFFRDPNLESDASSMRGHYPPEDDLGLLKSCNEVTSLLHTTVLGWICSNQRLPRFDVEATCGISVKGDHRDPMQSGKERFRSCAGYWNVAGSNGTETDLWGQPFMQRLATSVGAAVNVDHFWISRSRASP